MIPNDWSAYVNSTIASVYTSSVPPRSLPPLPSLFLDFVFYLLLRFFPGPQSVACACNRLLSHNLLSRACFHVPCLLSLSRRI
jgi:hypothetical protein